MSSFDGGQNENQISGVRRSNVGQGLRSATVDMFADPPRSPIDREGELLVRDILEAFRRVVVLWDADPCSIRVLVRKLLN